MAKWQASRCQFVSMYTAQTGRITRTAMWKRTGAWLSLAGIASHSNHILPKISWGIPPIYLGTPHQSQCFLPAPILKWDRLLQFQTLQGGRLPLRTVNFCRLTHPDRCYISSSLNTIWDIQVRPSFSNFERTSQADVYWNFLSSPSHVSTTSIRKF